MKCLGGDYEVEPGDGGKRNIFLRDHDIKTYLIKTGLNRTVVKQFLLSSVVVTFIFCLLISWHHMCTQNPEIC